MNSTHEPQLPGNTGDTSFGALNWKYALEDSALLEGRMAPVYPQRVNVILARVDVALCAVSGTCAHMACPLPVGRLEDYRIVCPCQARRCGQEKPSCGA
jgi:nitrite reductase/ring-hydroxylating ferredoxin subunit